MCPPPMVVAEVGLQDFPEVSLVENDHMVPALSANGSNHALRKRILPRAAGSDEHFFYSHFPDPWPEVRPVDPVSVAEEISWCFIP